MAKERGVTVTVTRTLTTPGGRTYNIKRIQPFARLIKDSIVEATAPALRILAEESREYILDRLFAGKPQLPSRIPTGLNPTPVDRPKILRAANIPTAARQAFKHKPLKDYVVQRKADRGYDLRKLIETGALAESIEVFKGERSKGGTYYMLRLKKGFHGGADPRSGRITNLMLARVHEFGSAKHRIPPRPIWKPASRAIIARFRQLAPTISADILRAILRSIR